MNTLCEVADLQSEIAEMRREFTRDFKHISRTIRSEGIVV
jgi:hypothetical protein